MFSTRSPNTKRHCAASVRARIAEGGERIWRFEDFRDLSLAAVAQALSRLARAGDIERLSKGTYFRPRATAFGTSRPNPAKVQLLAAKGRRLFPAGVAAANLLGFSTQTASRNEIATSANSVARKLVGEATVVHTRRPEAWSSLSVEEGALLDFLRQAGRTSELSEGDTIRRILELLGRKGRFEALVRVAGTEPPRVRAMLGAIGEALGKRASILAPLRASLNPLSRFEFGRLGALTGARNWQAMEPRR